MTKPPMQHCDGCGEPADDEGPTLPLGWRMVPDDNGYPWTFCPDCRETLRPPSNIEKPDDYLELLDWRLPTDGG